MRAKRNSHRYRDTNIIKFKNKSSNFIIPRYILKGNADELDGWRGLDSNNLSDYPHRN